MKADSAVRIKRFSGVPVTGKEVACSERFCCTGICRAGSCSGGTCCLLMLFSLLRVSFQLTCLLDSPRIIRGGRTGLVWPSLSWAGLTCPMVSCCRIKNRIWNFERISIAFLRDEAMELSRLHFFQLREVDLVEKVVARVVDVRPEERVERKRIDHVIEMQQQTTTGGFDFQEI